jgi:DGQHR domain-containing protein
MIKIPFIEIEQPLGIFYLSKMKASDIVRIAQADQLSTRNPQGIQRTISVNRIKEIANYCTDPDATFPTPIIISVNDNSDVQIEQSFFKIDDSKIIGNIIDGQHRIEGIRNSTEIEKFELPVVLMFNLTEEEKAYVFSIINSKQTKVSMSLIYDLFEVSEGRSPQKTCHEIARIFNNDVDSPFYNRLKMLGKKETDQNNPSVAQGTFVKYLLNLISKNPDDDFRKLKSGINIEIDDRCPLRHYFIANQDDLIYKILFNMFSAVRSTFTEEWDNPNNFVISKTVGYGALIKAFPVLYAIGFRQKTLKREFFEQFFRKVKEDLIQQNTTLDSVHFPSNEHGLGKLAKFIVEVVHN